MLEHSKFHYLFKRLDQTSEVASDFCKFRTRHGCAKRCSPKHCGVRIPRSICHQISKQLSVIHGMSGCSIKLHNRRCTIILGKRKPRASMGKLAFRFSNVHCSSKVRILEWVCQRAIAIQFAKFQFEPFD